MASLSLEEQDVFNDHIQKLKALKLSSCASDTLRNLLADEKSYDYFIGLEIPELYEIYRDLIVYPDPLASDVYEIQLGCRFRNYQTFLIWTMLQKHADEGDGPEKDSGLPKIVHDLHTTSSAKNIISLLDKMKEHERIDFFQKIEYRFAAPLLVAMESNDAAKIIDGLPSSKYNTRKLIETMFYLLDKNYERDSDYKTAEICALLSETTIQDIFLKLEVDMTVDMLYKVIPGKLQYIFSALINNPDCLAKAFKDLDKFDIAKFLETRNDPEIISVLKIMSEDHKKDILLWFDDRVRAEGIYSLLRY